MVRIPLHSSGKYLSFWLKKKQNSPYETLVISLVSSKSMKTTQDDNLPKKRASTSVRKYRKLLGHAQETSLMVHRVQPDTSHLRDFQPEDTASHVFLNCPLSDSLEPTWMMWLSPWSLLRADPLSYYNFTLLLESLPPSIFSFGWPMLLCLPLSSCWHFLLFTYMSQTPKVDPGPWVA